MDDTGLFAKLERNLDQIHRSPNVLATLSAILERLVEDFRDDLGVVGGRIYVRSDNDFVLQTEYPGSGKRIGFRIPAFYEPVQQLLQQGFVLYELSDPGIDRELERALGVGNFAAVCVGRTRPQIVAFSLKDSSDHQRVIYNLNTIRHVINLKLRKEHLEGRLAEARLIQLAYTDGIIEAKDDEDRMFGTERLKPIVRSKPWTDARQLVEAVFEEVRRFSAARTPDDDQTVAAVIRRPSA